MYISRNQVPIRLTEERWAHIAAGHPEMAGLRQALAQTLSSPDRVLAGGAQELLAVRMIGTSKAMVVVYRETGPEDGFVITAFLTRRFAGLDRREQPWP